MFEMKLEKEKEKSESRKEELDVEKEVDLKKNRRDRDRDRRKNGEGSGKDRRKRVKRSDSEDREDNDEEREKHKERRRRDHREIGKRSDSDEEDERDKCRTKEKAKGHREHERDRGKDPKREREREREVRVRERGRRNQVSRDDGNKESDDDVKPDSKRRRKKPEKIVGGCSRHLDHNGDKDGEKKENHEQKKIDEEVDKRRRRIQEWQELKRKNEEAETESKAGKAWTLDGDSDDEEVPLESEIDVQGDAKMVELECGGGKEIDPLDAFMNTMVLPEVEKLTNNNASLPLVNDVILESGDQPKKSFNKALGRILQGEDSDVDYSEPENDDDDPSLEQEDEEFIKSVKKTKADKLSLVDHSKIEYVPFRKNFYIEVKDISRMTQEEVNAYIKELELKVHGKDVPRPIKSWHQTGLTSKILNTMKKLNFEKPMPIQAQALPIIMSGRDCIGVAKTGSGKTLGFVLPMLRHIKDQPLVEDGDGPIGLVMAPTRELVQQIHSDIKKFAKPLGIRCVPVYGGSGVAQQISELKRGTEIVVCTPGRMIDILCTSSGKITNLRRVTFLVMDEADRMFDMGFEPQIKRIIQNIRPDRQTVFFSATFPRQVETLARKVLNKPVEIQVGGRSVVNKDITQLVEIRPESERFRRLVELLKEWNEKGKILVFVQSQKKCDALSKDIRSKGGYVCLSLHGGMDQTIRESTVSDFKNNICNLLVATSVAARGLDVKELELVVNFDAPSHYEDYVHRVGRTGRAGREGCAVTFISEDDAKYAPDLVKALELSEQPVPDELKAVADGFMAKVKQGIEQAHGSGYGGSGFKFNDEEEEVRKAAKKAQAKEYGFEVDTSDSEYENDIVRKVGGHISQQAAIAAAKASATPVNANQLLPNGGGLPITAPGLPSDGDGLATAMAAVGNLQHTLAKIQADAMPERYEAELEINDFPQNARWKVTHKGTLGPITEWSGAAITTRGQFFTSGRVPRPGERKLYLFIEGPTEISVKAARGELKRLLLDITKQPLSLPRGPQPGRYSVLW